MRGLFHHGILVHFFIINNWLHLHCLQVVIDYNDLMRIPYFRNNIVENTKYAAKARYYKFLLTVFFNHMEDFLVLS